MNTCHLVCQRLGHLVRQRLDHLVHTSEARQCLASDVQGSKCSQNSFQTKYLGTLSPHKGVSDLETSMDYFELP